MSPDYSWPIAIEKTPNRLIDVLREQRFGSHDPTCRLETDGFLRGLLTPLGAACLEVRILDDAHMEVAARGPGADWVMEHRKGFLGLEDRIPVIEPKHDAVARAAKRHGLVPLARSLCPHQELITAILGQRITAREATIQWSRLVRRLGHRIPDVDVHVPPSAEALRSFAFHEYHAIGIEMSRARTLRALGDHTRLVHNCWEDSGGNPSLATQALRAIPGVGQWTAAVAGGAAFGDPDALRVGDFHVKNTIAWALRGRARGTDEEMESDLAVYAGQRHRVVRWLQMDGWSAPARGPRRPIVDIRRR